MKAQRVPPVLAAGRRWKAVGPALELRREVNNQPSTGASCWDMDTDRDMDMLSGCAQRRRGGRCE